MAGFERFKIDDIAHLSRRLEVDAVCEDHRSLILQSIFIPGFKPKKQVAFGRDGVIYEWEHDKNIKFFVGLWLSDEGWYIKFPKETGPQVIVFFEVPPKHTIRNHLFSSREYARVSKEFLQAKDGWQVLLRRRPLIEFLDSQDQTRELLNFYSESIDDLRDSGLLELLVK